MKNLTDTQVANLKIRLHKKTGEPVRYFYADPQCRGHYVRVGASGSKSFVATARDPHRGQIWHTIGDTTQHKIEDSRDEARKAIKRIKASLPPAEALPPKPLSFENVARDWLEQEAVKFRTLKDVTRCLEKYVFPHWSELHFESIKRTTIKALLDGIAKKHGKRQADLVLANIALIAHWYATWHDDYVSPVIKGMRKGKRVARDRRLEDDEIRKVWKLAGDEGSFGNFVRMLLLTAQRRGAVLQMRWDDISRAGVWTIPKEDRAKGNLGAVKLPAPALAIIEAQPRIANNAYVFASDRTDGPLAGLGKSKNRFAARCKLASRWTLHDLRRTARSLLSRCDVRIDIAERVLGHARPTIEATYDKHSYIDEKSDALAKLASLIGEIVDDPQDKVVPIRPRRKAGR